MSAFFKPCSGSSHCNKGLPDGVEAGKISCSAAFLNLGSTTGHADYNAMAKSHAERHLQHICRVSQCSHKTSKGTLAKSIHAAHLYSFSDKHYCYLIYVCNFQNMRKMGHTMEIQGDTVALRFTLPREFKLPMPIAQLDDLDDDVREIQNSMESVKEHTDAVITIGLKSVKELTDAVSQLKVENEQLKARIAQLEEFVKNFSNKSVK